VELEVEQVVDVRAHKWILLDAIDDAKIVMERRRLRELGAHVRTNSAALGAHEADEAGRAIEKHCASELILKET
jgi:hypothetical protein